MKISPLAELAESYAAQIKRLLGRGALHADICYREFIRSGQMSKNHGAFANCPELFEEIVEASDLSIPDISHVQKEGETKKFLMKTADGYEIESVILPMQAGGTLCISSQVGCRLGCRFCETGRMGLLRNLDAREICAQVFAARHLLKSPIRNVVFMGMGEPLDNFDNVSQAIGILKDPAGFGFGRSNITLSTSGCVPMMDRLPELGINLAVSVNAPSDEIRSRLMPINRKYPMATLYEAMKRYCEKTGKQILVAYVLIGGVTDELSYADQLASYLDGLNVKVNVIPYNPQSRHGMQPPARERVDAFVAQLRSLGLSTMLRQTKGQDIMAACGQLGKRSAHPKPHATLPSA